MALVALALVGGAMYAVFIRNDNPPAPLGTVTINNKIFHVEVADTSLKRERGLSGRDRVGGGADGMLFVFETPASYSFHMKDMRFPIDIIWIKDNRVIGISDSLEPSTEPVPPTYYPPDNVNYVLEFPAGFAGRYGIDKGAEVAINLTNAK